METDVLGAPFEQRQLTLAADDEGDVIATLVRARAAIPTRRAVLYLHGYVDYFFQRHLAEFYTTRGYDFYALDLRKYGRSLLPHQTPNFITAVSEYFTEVDEAVRIIRDEDGHDTLLLNGHSTGGLIGALWANRVRGNGLVQAIFLNSPFFQFNEGWVTLNVVAPIVSLVGARKPKQKLPQELGTTYGRSIHSSEHGEWDYDLRWKPLNGYANYAGWARAMRAAHKRVQAGLAIDVPILVACSSRSYKGPFTEAAHHADSVLNVDDIVKFAPGLGRDVAIVRIDGGKHDLTLSPPAARERLFALLDAWLTATLGTEKSVDNARTAGEGAAID